MSRLLRKDYIRVRHFCHNLYLCLDVLSDDLDGGIVLEEHDIVEAKGIGYVGKDGPKARDNVARE